MYQQPHICRWYHSNGRKRRETKEPLDEGERGEWKADLNLTFKKLRSWHVVPSLQSKCMGKKVEALTDFIFLGSKITADGDCSHEIKRHMLLERKAMTNLDGVLKSRDITLTTKICLVKAVIFSSSHVRMWKLDCKEGWRLKNWCFLTMVLEKTLKSA